MAVERLVSPTATTTIEPAEQERNWSLRPRTIAEYVGQPDLIERLGITIGPIASMQDIAANPHYRERQSLVEVPDPVTGIDLQLPNVPFRLQATPGRIRFPGLPLGAANAVIYRDLLGYSEEQIRQMGAGGVI